MLELVRIARGGHVYPITIAEMQGFDRDISSLLSEDERSALVEHIALNPEAGVVIPGTGGIRKLRWMGAGKGKSKGIRIIYFYHDLNMPVFLLAVYSKGERLRLTKVEERAMAKIADSIRDEYARKRSRRCDVGGIA
ncbi:addiction module toxin RelE [Aureimonas mangrovi]|uniref:addiction module toxin RelE n=1 Tax=Aureimonas mangrovi TaxID=2758041 RepID=UPI00163DE158|nr:addiction module toxin RelE [Aureimonas mangrovi]